MEAIKGGQLVGLMCEELKQEVRKDKLMNFQILDDRVLGYKSG